MYFFNSVLTEKFDQLEKNRKKSVKHYVDYMSLLAHTGHLHVIYNLFFNIDRCFILEFPDFLETPTYKYFSELFGKIDQNKYVVLIIKKLLQNADSISNTDLTKALNDFFMSLKPESSNAEQNFMLNFVFLQVSKRNLLDAHQALNLTNYFIKAKHCNKYRKEFCMISIVEYCQYHQYKDFFKLKNKFYNHLQRVYHCVYESVLLNKHQQKILIRQISQSIKLNNDIQREITKPKVAVCISGLYRGHKQALESIYENLVVPYDADVFVHSWDQESTWLGFGGSPFFSRVFGINNMAFAPNEIHDLFKLQDYLPNTFKILKEPIYQNFTGKIFKEIFSPKKIIIENQKEFERKIVKDSNYTMLRGSLNQVKMFHGIKASLDLALAYNDYDYIVRIRPDVLITQRVSFEHLENNTIYANFGQAGLHDAEFIASSSVMFSLSQLISQMFCVKKISPYHAFPLYDSHNLLLLWMIENDYVFSQGLTGKHILTASDVKTQIPQLKQSLMIDFEKMTLEHQQKFLPFVQFLEQNYVDTV